MVSIFKHRSSAPSDRGAILMAVLGFIFLIAVFVTQFLEIATRQMRSRAVELGRSDLRSTAYSAMEVTVAVLKEIQEIDGGLFAPAQGWGDPINYAGMVWPDGVEVRVMVEDETGRVAINPPQEAELRVLLDQLGIPFDQADILVDSLLDWIDEDDMVRLNGAEDAYYERLDPPYLPANGPLDSLDTLRWVRGFRDTLFDENGNPNSLFHAFARSVSLHHNRRVNVNTAPAAVLAFLAERYGVDATQFEDYLAGSDRVRGTLNDQIIRSREDLRLAGFPGEAGRVGYEVAVIRVVVEVESGTKSFRLSAILDTGGGQPAGGGAPGPGGGAPGPGGGGGGQAPTVRPPGSPGSPPGGGPPTAGPPSGPPSGGPPGSPPSAGPPGADGQPPSLRISRPTQAPGGTGQGRPGAPGTAPTGPGGFSLVRMVENSKL